VRIFIAITTTIFLLGPASAQTQPTRPAAWATLATLHSSWATSGLSRCYSSLNPTSPCYSSNSFPYYSAVPLEPLASPSDKEAVDVSQLSEQEVKQRMKLKGYEVAKLERDGRGI
jgi:hypothetical protein